MLLVLLLLCFLAGLVLVPFGLPGLWVMVGGVLGYGALTEWRTVGLATIALTVGLAAVGELAEWWLGFRYARRYGGSARAGWGALVGGLVGAVIGIPVPIVGSILGAFAGAFAGAAVFEYTLARDTRRAASAGWGALLGRVAATAAKVALGLVIAVVTLFAILRA